MSRSSLLQDWVTVHADAAPAVGTGVSQVTQTQGEWLDVSSFSAATFWIDVTEVLAPSGANVILTLQTSPTLDEPYFLPAAVPINPLLAAPTPLVVQTVRGVGLVPLARNLRWQLSTDSPGISGTWGATFRIRVAPSLQSSFVPTDVGGCVLWLRADLGISFYHGNVIGWADQSGSGNDASATPGSQPPLATNVMNGAPAIVGDGFSTWMQTAAFTLGASATLFAAVQPAASPQTTYARLLEHEFDQTYYLGTDTTGTQYQLIVDDASPPFGTAVGGTVTPAANTIVSGVYSSSTGTGSLYVNGALAASDSVSFTTPTPISLPMAIMQSYNNVGSDFWSGLFAEAIVYDRDLNASELARVHRYLAARYAVAM